MTDPVIETDIKKSWKVTQQEEWEHFILQQVIFQSPLGENGAARACLFIKITHIYERSTDGDTGEELLLYKALENLPQDSKLYDDAHDPPSFLSHHPSIIYGGLNILNPTSHPSWAVRKPQPQTDGLQSLRTRGYMAGTGSSDAEAYGCSPVPCWLLVSSAHTHTHRCCSGWQIAA